MRAFPALLCIAISLASITAAADCTINSAERPVPVLELYTSEGCDSCPPADRWVSELRARGFGPDRIVVLAFHVDYWDKLGWIDPFAQGRFSERQRYVNNRNGMRTIYTPQLLLNGKDYQRSSDADFAKRITQLAQQKPRAAMNLQMKSTGNRLSVTGTWLAAASSDAQGWLALYENRLSTDVKAGENRNKRLHHEYVVRDIAGPFPTGALEHVFKLDASWKRADLGVAGFVQNARTGDVLQAVALPCSAS